MLETLTDEDHAIVYLHRVHPDPSTDPCITEDDRAVTLGLCVDDDNSLGLDETGGGLLDRDGKATFTRHTMLYHGSRTMARAHVDEFVELADGEPTRLWLHSNGTSRIHYVTHRLIDASNNTETCTHKITVVDPEEPTFTCPPDVTVATVPGQHYTTITVHNQMMRGTTPLRFETGRTERCNVIAKSSMATKCNPSFRTSAAVGIRFRTEQVTSQQWIMA